MVWERSFLKLQQFHAKKGHCYAGYGRSQRMLRAWCDEQCLLYRQGRLEPEQIKALQNLQFDFLAFGGHWRSWWQHYEQMKAFVAEHGHANVPQRVERIGPWLCAQRVQYRRGGMPDNRRRLLEALGMEWAPAERLDAQWTEQFGSLKEHYEQHGNLNQLASAWISAQRTAFRKKILPENRISLLESIGFRWSARS